MHYKINASIPNNLYIVILKMQTLNLVNTLT